MAHVSVINDSSEFLDLMGDILRSVGHQMTGFQAVDVTIEEIVRSQPDVNEMCELVQTLLRQPPEFRKTAS
jgi:hypothetical protein